MNEAVRQYDKRSETMSCLNVICTSEETSMVWPFHQEFRLHVI